MSEYKLKPLDSGEEVKEFYNKYFTEKISFSANKVDSVVGFFTKRGFDESSAIAVSSILLEQAKIDDVDVFTLLDTLNGLEDIQISAVVAEILNYNRSKSSVLGFKVEKTDKTELRNIVV